MRYFSWLRCVVIGALFLLVSCNDNDSGIYWARSINAVNDGPVSRVQFDEVTSLASILYTEATPLAPAITQDSDSQARSVNVLGLLPDGESFSIVSLDSFVFQAATEYTIVTGGTLADPILVMANNARRTKPVSGAYLQVTHVATQYPGLDVYLTDPDEDLANAIPFATIALGEFTDSQEVPNATYRLRITPAGAAQVLFDREVNLFEGNAEWHFSLIDNLNASDSPLRVIVTADLASEVLDSVGQNSALKALNVSPSSGSVDVYVDSDPGTPLAENISYKEASFYAPVLPDTSVDDVFTTTTFTVTATGDPETILLEEAEIIQSGREYTYLFFEAQGEEAEPDLSAILYQDDRRSVSSEAKLRFLQALETDNFINVYLTEEPPAEDPPTENPTWRLTPYLFVSGYFRFMPGTRYLTVTSVTPTDQTETTLIGPVEIELGLGDVLTLMLAQTTTEDPTAEISFIDDQAL